MIVAAFSLFEAWVAVSANMFDLAMRPMTGCVDRLTKTPTAPAAAAEATR